MHRLLKNPRLKLYLARDKKIMEDTFSSNLDGWQVTQGEWHKMTIDTNADQSSGLAGGLALDSAGSYNGGTMEKTVFLKEYGEIVFEYYVQNPKAEEEPNRLLFYVDGQLKLEAKGATPWIRCEPIGLTAGEHHLKFVYEVGSNPMGKKGVVDTVTIYEGRHIQALITEHKPPKPMRSIASQKILRGYTRRQEMTESDTVIEFTVCFNGLDFHDFIMRYESIFYFLDEFGVLYRGTFPDTPDTKSVAMNSIYYIDLKLECPQTAGFGFC